MASKLMTLKELSEYLGISEQCIVELIDANVIIAYKIGGELLRFRKEQIDAIRAEIDSRVKDLAGNPPGKMDPGTKERIRAFDDRGAASPFSDFSDRVKDFIYFNNFYIVSAGLIVLLVLFILKG